MISVEEKVDIFKEELRSKITQLEQQETTQLNDLIVSEEEKTAHHITQEVESLKERYQKLMDREISKEISLAHKKSKDYELLLIKKIRLDFFDSLKKLVTNKGFKNYQKILESNINQAQELNLNFNEATIFINQSDLDFLPDSFKQALIKPLEESYLGGFIIQTPKVRYDFSLKSLLEEKEEEIALFLTTQLRGVSNG